MAGEKQAPLVPKLRFPEFADGHGWEVKPLDSISDRVTETVQDLKLTPISISAGKGFVPQTEKFGRDISGEQYARYIRLRRGYFAYNRGNSKAFPQGCVYQLNDFEEVAASNAFLCFQLHDKVEPDLLLGFFEANGHGRQLARHITSSARSNGLLNISADTFFATKIPLPPTEAEQQKIAECLGSLDDLIAAEGRKLDALHQHKKGLMQQLFPRPERIENGKKIPAETVPRLRFPEFRDAGEWKRSKLGVTCHLQAGKFVAASDIWTEGADGRFPCYGGNGLRGYTSTFTHSGKLPLIGRQGALCGNVKLGIERFHATEHAVVATPKSGVSVDWLFHLLEHLNLNQFATGQAQPGLSVDVLVEVAHSIPETKIEQQLIADCLSGIGDAIGLQSQKLDAFKKHKSGLLQQLFPSLEGH